MTSLIRPIGGWKHFRRWLKNYFFIQNFTSSVVPVIGLVIIKTTMIIGKTIYGLYTGIRLEPWKKSDICSCAPPSTSKWVPVQPFKISQKVRFVLRPLLFNHKNIAFKDRTKKESKICFIHLTFNQIYHYSSLRFCYTDTLVAKVLLC